MIYHDYEGIAKWCTGEWKSKKVETKAYKNFYNEISKNIDIDFKWVKGHSNDEYNDRADALASKAHKLTKISSLLIDSISVYINKEEIDYVLEEILKQYKNYQILNKEENDNFKRFEITIDNKNVIIRFNYKWAGDISIQYEGDHIGYEIKKNIENTYAIKDNIKNSWLTFTADIEKVESLLKNLKQYKGIQIKNIKGNKEDIYSIYEIEYGTNFLKCTIFKNNKVLFQGKSSILFSAVITLLNELEIINTDKLIELSNNAYELKNKPEIVIEELKLIIPNSFDKLHNKVKQNLCTSLILLKTPNSHFEYSWVTFPALKSLEGILKAILLEENITISHSEKFSKVFLVDSNKVSIHNKYANRFNNPNSLCAMYDFFRKNRHTTFHFDQLIENSRSIETIEEAKEIVYSVMKLIEVHYS